MLKLCELVEDFPARGGDNAMPAVVTVKVNDVYLALSRVMDLPPADSWLDD